MTYKVISALCLAGLLLTVGGPQGFAQSVDRADPARLSAMPSAAQLDVSRPASPAADTTLSFYDLTRSVLIDVNLGEVPDRTFKAVGLFFDAPFNGTVDQVDFALSDFPPSPGVAGTGTLRIKLIESPFVLTEPLFQPGIDSLDVDFSDLAARQFPQPGSFINQIDLTNRDFEVVEGEQYFLQLGFADVSNDAALTFVFDGGSNDTLDTRYFPARSFVFVDSLDADAFDEFLVIRDSRDTTFVNTNILLELHLTRTPPPPPPPPAATGIMQFVHNAPGAGMVDVYVSDSLVAQGLDFRQASPFVSVLAGEKTLDLVAAGDPDNSNPLFQTTTTIIENKPHWAVALGTGENLDVVVEERSGESGEERKVSYVILHGAEGASTIDLNILDETPDHALVSTIVNDLGFGRFVGPVSLDAGLFNIELAADDVQADVFRLMIVPSGGFGEGVFLLLTSGTLGGDPPLTLLTVDVDGNVGMPAVSTAIEEGRVPEAFALHGNFPNPFNPTTTIRFDLGAPGFTTLTVYNLLGQAVATLVAEPLEAGAYALPFDASHLPSGPYLYRLTSGTFAQQRMLMLVK